MYKKIPDLIDSINILFISINIEKQNVDGYDTGLFGEKIRFLTALDLGKCLKQIR